MPLPKRLLLIGILVILSGVLFEIGYFRWWPAILVTPLLLASAFALCRSRWGGLLLGLVGGFVALRIQQDALTVYNHSAANVLIFLNALTMIPVALAVQEGTRHGYRMAWVLPVAWVGAETLRMAGPSGLPFAVVGFACHEQAWMIQVADLGGPLLVSFAVAAANGVWLDFLLARGSGGQRLRRAMLPAGLAVGAAWVAIVAYGQLRMQQVERAMEPGLRIAVVQSDAILFPYPAKSYDGQVLLEELMGMSEKAAAAPAPPDLILWPEKTADIPLFNEEFFGAEFDLRMVPDESRAEAKADPAPFAAQWEAFRQERADKQARFIRWVDHLGIPVLAGLSHQRVGGGAFPHYFEQLNAATLFEPGPADQEEPRPSQFKMRLFPGAEYMPGGAGVWLKALGWLPPARRWIESVNNLATGQERVLMRVDEHPFVVAVCSEILHSNSAGVFADSPEGRQPVIVTLANEGLFQRNHSILVCKMAMAFRAVEARTTVARSTNGGISGFVDPAGRYHGFVTNDSGRYFTRLGAPDAAAIDAVLAFRREHPQEAVAADPALRDEHRRLVADVERLRALAGVQGFSIQETATTSLRTVYQRGGHHFPKAVLAAFALFLAFAWLRPRPVKGGLTRTENSHP